MKHAASQTLYDYWTRLRAGRAAPERSDIDPAQIRGILADTFLVEVEYRGPIRPPELTIRLSGTRVNALFDRDMKGSPLSTWWRADALALFETLSAAVLDDTCPVVIGTTGFSGGSPPLALEMLLLPLRHRGKTQARMLGALSPATTPPWLGLLPIKPLAVTSHRIIVEPIRSGTSRRSAIAPPAGALRRQAPARRGPFMIYEGGRSAVPDEHDTSLSRN